MGTLQDLPTSGQELFARRSSGLVRAASTTDASLVNLYTATFPIMVSFLLGIVLPFYGGANLYLTILIGALLAAPILVAYAVASSVMRRSGGDYVFISRLLHPALGFAANFVFVGFQIVFLTSIRLLLLPVVPVAAVEVARRLLLQPWPGELRQHAGRAAVDLHRERDLRDRLRVAVRAAQHALDPEDLPVHAAAEPDRPARVRDRSSVPLDVGSARQLRHLRAGSKRGPARDRGRREVRGVERLFAAAVLAGSHGAGDHLAVVLIALLPRVGIFRWRGARRKAHSAAGGSRHCGDRRCRRVASGLAEPRAAGIGIPRLASPPRRPASSALAARPRSWRSPRARRATSSSAS